MKKIIIILILLYIAGHLLNAFTESSVTDEQSAERIINAEKEQERLSIERTERAAVMPINNLETTFNFNFDRSTLAFYLAVTVKNENAFAVGDIFIRCTTYGETNTALNRLDYTVRRVIPASETLILERINMGFANSQTLRANCRVVAVSRA